MEMGLTRQHSPPQTLSPREEYKSRRESESDLFVGGGEDSQLSVEQKRQFIRGNTPQQYVHLLRRIPFRPCNCPQCNFFNGENAESDWSLSTHEGNSPPVFEDALPENSGGT